MPGIQFTAFTWELIQTTGSFYQWVWPGMVRDPGGEYQLFTSNFWNGLIDPDMEVEIQVLKESAFESVASFTIKFYIHRVPRKTQLPL